MRCITHNINDPYFNLAAEEYLLKYCTDDIFMLYVNRPSIIIGKHQNAYAEINMAYVNKNNIPVIRRLSGGGTVFHDLGNLNFTFIRNTLTGKQIDFKKFTTPILEVLHQLHVPASFSGRNDLLIEGLKFSGNAEHVYKNRTLHHGTLLFSSALENLREAIKVNPANYDDKAVKSVRSQVTNISHYLDKAYTLEKFRKDIFAHIQLNQPENDAYILTEQDISAIQSLAVTKYDTWEWNYGYSPRCTIRKTEYDKSAPIEITLDIENGKITRAIIMADHQPQDDIQNAICFMPYEPSALREKLDFTGNADVWIGLLF